MADFTASDRAAAASTAPGIRALGEIDRLRGELAGARAALAKCVRVLVSVEWSSAAYVNGDPVPVCPCCECSRPLGHEDVGCELLAALAAARAALGEGRA